MISSSTKIERLAPHEWERLRTIRLRSLTDAPGAFATTVEKAGAWSPEIWRQQAADIPTFIAVVNGQDEGIVRVAWDPETPGSAFLISMWVASTARGSGIGDALIDTIVNWGLSAGITRLMLDVCDENSVAIALYARHGLAVHFGLRLQHSSEHTTALPDRQRQLGVRHLLLYTAIVAVLVTTGHMVVTRSNVGNRLPSLLNTQVWIFVFLAAAGVVITLPLVLSAILPRRAAQASLLVFVLLGLATAAELPLLKMAMGLYPASGSRPQLRHLLVLNGFQAFWVFAVVGALRLGGYRLTTSSSRDESVAHVAVEDSRALT